MGDPADAARRAAQARRRSRRGVLVGWSQTPPGRGPTCCCAPSTCSRTGFPRSPAPLPRGGQAAARGRGGGPLLQRVPALVRRRGAPTARGVLHLRGPGPPPAQPAPSARRGRQPHPVELPGLHPGAQGRAGARRRLHRARPRLGEGADGRDAVADDPARGGTARRRAEPRARRPARRHHDAGSSTAPCAVCPSPAAPASARDHGPGRPADRPARCSSSAGTRRSWSSTTPTSTLALAQAELAKLRNTGQSCVGPTASWCTPRLAEEFGSRLASRFDALSDRDTAPPTRCPDLGPVIDADRVAARHLHRRRGGRPGRPSPDRRARPARRGFLGGADAGRRRPRRRAGSPPRRCSDRPPAIFVFDTEDEAAGAGQRHRDGAGLLRVHPRRGRAFRFAERLDAGIVGINDAAADGRLHPDGWHQTVRSGPRGRHRGPAGVPGDYLPGLAPVISAISGRGLVGARAPPSLVGAVTMRATGMGFASSRPRS